MKNLPYTAMLFISLYFLYICEAAETRKLLSYISKRSEWKNESDYLDSLPKEERDLFEVKHGIIYVNSIHPSTDKSSGNNPPKKDNSPPTSNVPNNTEPKKPDPPQVDSKPKTDPPPKPLNPPPVETPPKKIDSSIGENSPIKLDPLTNNEPKKEIPPCTNSSPPAKPDPQLAPQNKDNLSSNINIGPKEGPQNDSKLSQSANTLPKADSQKKPSLSQTNNESKGESQKSANSSTQTNGDSKSTGIPIYMNIIKLRLKEYDTTISNPIVIWVIPGGPGHSFRVIPGKTMINYIRAFTLEQQKRITIYIPEIRGHIFYRDDFDSIRSMHSFDYRIPSEKHLVIDEDYSSELFASDLLLTVDMFENMAKAYYDRKAKERGNSEKFRMDHYLHGLSYGSLIAIRAMNMAPSGRFAGFISDSGISPGYLYNDTGTQLVSVIEEALEICNIAGKDNCPAEVNNEMLQKAFETPDPDAKRSFMKQANQVFTKSQKDFLGENVKEFNDTIRESFLKQVDKILTNSQKDYDGIYVEEFNEGTKESLKKQADKTLSESLLELSNNYLKELNESQYIVYLSLILKRALIKEPELSKDNELIHYPLLALALLRHLANGIASEKYFTKALVGLIKINLPREGIAVNYPQKGTATPSSNEEVKNSRTTLNADPKSVPEPAPSKDAKGISNPPASDQIPKTETLSNSTLNAASSDDEVFDPKDEPLPVYLINMLAFSKIVLSELWSKVDSDLLNSYYKQSTCSIKKYLQTSFFNTCHKDLKSLLGKFEKFIKGFNVAFKKHQDERDQLERCELAQTPKSPRTKFLLVSAGLDPKVPHHLPRDFSNLLKRNGNNQVYYYHFKEAGHCPILHNLLSPNMQNLLRDYFFTPQGPILPPIDPSGPTLIESFDPPPEYKITGINWDTMRPYFCLDLRNPHPPSPSPTCSEESKEGKSIDTSLKDQENESEIPLRLKIAFGCLIATSVVTFFVFFYWLAIQYRIRVITKRKPLPLSTPISSTRSASVYQQ
jgi:hypothetical protein